MKIEKSMHSNDCKVSFRGKSQEDYEKEWGLDGITSAFKQHGWTRWQWSVYTEADLKKYKTSTMFIEVFSDDYHGYIRADSRKSILEVFEKALNRMMKFNACEIKTGHVYKAKNLFDNGVLECIHCGFWGYTNHFAILQRKKDHYKYMAHHMQQKAANLSNIASKFGFAFNLSDGFLLRKNIKNKKYTRLTEQVLTNEFLKDLRKVFKKHKYIQRISRKRG